MLRTSLCLFLLLSACTPVVTAKQHVPDPVRCWVLLANLGVQFKYTVPCEDLADIRVGEAYHGE